MKSMDYKSGYHFQRDISPHGVNYEVNALRNPKNQGKMTRVYRARVPDQRKKTKNQRNKYASYLATGVLIGGLAALVASSGCVGPFGDFGSNDHNKFYDPYPDIASSNHKTVDALKDEIKKSESEYPGDNEKEYKFGVGNKTHKLKLKLSSQLHDYFAKGPPQEHANFWANLENFLKSIIWSSGDLEDDLNGSGYNQLIGDSKDKPFIWKFLYDLSRETKAQDSDDLAIAVADFVESGLSYNNSTPKLTYPYNAIWLGDGDCDQKSLLMVECFKELNYTTGLFVYEKAKHTAAGIGAPAGYGNYSSGLFFIEATGESALGNTSGKYGPYRNITLDKDPKIIYLKRDGKLLEKLPKILAEQEELNRKYGNAWSSSTAEQKLLLEKIYQLRQQREKINATFHDVDAKIKANNEIIKAYNANIQNQSSDVANPFERSYLNKKAELMNQNQTRLRDSEEKLVGEYNATNGQINDTVELYKSLASN